jgi:hypothetical protein
LRILAVSSERNTRYDEIMRRIQAHKREQARESALEPLAEALNDLNATGYLEDVQAEEFGQILCFGPKVLSGESWMAVVVWCRPRGYYSYRTLTLLGLWATLELESGEIVIILGTTTLPFRGQYFNPEAYFKHIGSRFDLYYAGAVSPPPEENHRYTTTYDPARRLDIRRAIESELAQWVESHR